MNTYCDLTTLTGVALENCVVHWQTIISMTDSKFNMISLTLLPAPELLLSQERYFGITGRTISVMGRL